MTPSETFIIYVQDVIRLESTRPRPCPLDELKRRFWDAAQFDSYVIAKNSAPLLDELGVPREEAEDYAVIITMTLREYQEQREGKC